MTIGQFRLLTKDADDDTPLLIPGSDHSYRDAEATKTTALREKYGYNSYGWTEDYGEDMTPEAEYGKRTDVIVLT